MEAITLLRAATARASDVEWWTYFEEAEFLVLSTAVCSGHGESSRPTWIIRWPAANIEISIHYARQLWSRPWEGGLDSNKTTGNVVVNCVSNGDSK